MRCPRFSIQIRQCAGFSIRTCLMLGVWASLGGYALAGDFPGGDGVPEIGPDSLASALTVLIGGALALTGWRKRK